MDRIERFTVGNGNFPNWFNNELLKGRGKVNRDLYTNDVTSVTIYTVGGTLNAMVGDVIMKTRNGMTVIPAEKARQYL